MASLVQQGNYVKSKGIKYGKGHFSLRHIDSGRRHDLGPQTSRAKALKLGAALIRGLKKSEILPELEPTASLELLWVPGPKVALGAALKRPAGAQPATPSSSSTTSSDSSSSKMYPEVIDLEAEAKLPLAGLAK